MADNRFTSGFGPVTYAPAQTVPPERREAEAVLTQIPGVEGVGEGRDDIGDPAWIAYIRDGSVAPRLPARIGTRAVLPLTSGQISIRPTK